MTVQGPRGRPVKTNTRRLVKTQESGKTLYVPYELQIVLVPVPPLFLVVMGCK
jgi:hypothetical protein